MVRTSGQFPQTSKPHKHNQNRDPEPGWLLGQPLMASNPTPDFALESQLWFEISPIFLTKKKDPTGFNAFLRQKAVASGKLWRYRGFSLTTKNTASFLSKNNS